MVQSQAETGLVQVSAIQNGVFQRLLIVGLTATGLAESDLFIERARRDIRLANLEKHGFAVALFRGFEQGSEKALADTGAV